MSIIKQFDCENCGAHGKISLKGDDYEYRDIEHCPVCGGTIYDSEDDELMTDE